MPKRIPEYLSYFLEDCLQWDKQFSFRRMFGEYAIYKNWKIFSFCIDEVIYFKVWEDNIWDYKEKNSKPFTYKKKNGIVWVMCYYELPEEILENREELDLWINKSLEVKSKIKKSLKKTLYKVTKG